MPHGRRLSGADVMATLLVGSAATASILWFTDIALTGWSTRLLAAVVFALGYLTCMTARARMAQVYGVQGEHLAPMAYLVVSSALGAAALARTTTRHHFIAPQATLDGGEPLNGTLGGRRRRRAEAGRRRSGPAQGSSTRRWWSQ